MHCVEWFVGVWNGLEWKMVTRKVESWLKTADGELGKLIAVYPERVCWIQTRRGL
jgi:hypothetical protein